MVLHVYRNMLVGGLASLRGAGYRIVSCQYYFKNLYSPSVSYVWCSHEQVLGTTPKDSG